MLKPTPLVRSTGDDGTSDLPLRSLFEKEESALLRYAFSLVGRREVAEEIVQDLFLRLHAQWSDVSDPRAWLYRGVRNRAFNYVRDNKREILHCDGTIEATRGAKERTPDQRMQQMEEKAFVRNLLTELSPTDRDLVRLKYFENQTYREIAAQTGLSVSNVGYRLHHILKELAGKLRSLGIDGDS